MPTYERYTAPGGKPGYRKTSGVVEDVKAVVRGLARMAAPRALRERKSDLDDLERKYDGQTTDSNNRY